MNSKPRKASVLRARCEPGLRDAVEEIARAVGLDASDIVRAAIRAYVRQPGSMVALHAAHHATPAT